ncbi:hypothetical protein VNI00_004796 [Paramarasmius palmivorus]|uniref:F-box domain-containing protein n=1 Tax=Paramarasmius palmivorus TaxID=297713 RepID=A0AAW0DI09_9AGAR
MDAAIQPPSAQAENLLNTNHPLSSTDREVYQREHLVVNRRRADIEYQMLVALGRYLTLLAEDTRLDGYAQVYKRILNPIRALPDGILHQIFLTCLEQSTSVLLPMRRYDTRNYTLDPTKPPWTLGQVCRRWRQLILSSPCLWTFVHFQIPDPGTPFQEISGMVGRLASSLRRSGTLPLTVVVSSTRSPNPNHPLLLSLYSHSHRWAAVRFKLTIEDLDIFTSMSLMIQANVPVLQTVELELLGLLPGPGVIDAFQFAPVLQNVVFFYYIGGAGRRVVLKMPWAQVKRYYRLSPLENEVAVTNDPLPEMGNIVHFHDHLQLYGAGTQFRLPFLQTLSLWPRMSPLVIPLEITTLDCIRTGRDLCELRIPNLAWSSLSSFLGRSGSTIERLSCRDNFGVHSFGVFKYLPALVSLTIEEPRQDLIQCLAKKDQRGQPIFVPRLRSLNLYGDIEFRGEGLMEMVSPR